MAILQAALAAIANQASSVLNTAFGWATMMLFGKVPSSRQTYVSVIAFGSVIWLVALLGIALPWFATFLLSFVTLSSWVDKTWIRLAMLAAAVAIPLVVGVVSILMLDPAQRPKDAAGKAKQVLRGYPYTIGLAITLVMMTVLAPVMQIRNMAKRWTSEHVPVMVEPEDYMSVVGDVEAALKQGGFTTHRERATWMMRLPTKVLTTFAGSAVNNLVADQLTVLKSKQIEVLLHPSDLVISGKEMDAARAHAVVARQMTFTDGYLTWDKEANQVEDRLRAIWDELRAGHGELEPTALARLAAVERDLNKLKVPFDEWEVLFREKLQVERGLLQVAAGVTDQPKELTEASPEELSTPTRVPAGRQPDDDVIEIEIPLPRQALPPILAGGAAVLAFVAVAWGRLTGRRPIGA